MITVEKLDVDNDNQKDQLNEKRATKKLEMKMAQTKHYASQTYTVKGIANEKDSKILPFNSYMRRRMTNLQDRKWEENLEIFEMEENKTTPKLFRDFLPKGMTTKMAVIEKRNSKRIPKKPLEKKDASNAPSSADKINSARDNQPTKVGKPIESGREQVTPRKKEDKSPSASGFDSSRKKWSENLIKTGEKALDTTDAYLRWLLIENYDEV